MFNASDEHKANLLNNLAQAIDHLEQASIKCRDLYQVGDPKRKYSTKINNMVRVLRNGVGEI